MHTHCEALDMLALARSQRLRDRRGGEAWPHTAHTEQKQKKQDNAPQFVMPVLASPAISTRRTRSRSLFFFFVS